MARRISAAILIPLILIVLLAGCSKPKVETQSRVLYSYFDTVTMVSSYAGDDVVSFEANCIIVEDILRDYHRMMDIYHEYDGMNNLCTVNLNAGKDPVKVDPRLIEVLLFSKRLCELTGGKMDITMGSVLSLWHEARAAEPQHLPSEEALKKAGKHMGFELLEIDEKNSTVRITDPEASIDLGAVGKGFATEVAAMALEEKGVTGYVINAGGNLRCIGTKADGSGWVTGIRKPQDPDNLALTVTISNTSCVTSGGYERFLEFGGVRYSHLIDKETLWPAFYHGSVTIITEDSGLADALATAVFCMGYEDGLALVESFDNVQCIWIGNDGHILHTKGLDKKIKEL